ncbi:hypothetical protein [Georgenia halophila]|uniref:hypothetical protein n=1 Tax=Georgenia halophila TaxID=620889 RepID=UPI0031E9329C
MRAEDVRAADGRGLEPVVRHSARHSVSLGLEDVVDPQQDWDEVAARLDGAGVNTVHVSAGRVEFTAFDWDAHPEAAAEPGTDHLARALDNVGALPDGTCREVGIVIDAYVPAWIADDPSIAGLDTSGRRSTYTPSASALLEGAVGERYIEYLVAVAERYQPDQVSFSELAFDDETFGEEDLTLYRSMTGASDWPRRSDGTVDEDAVEVGAWRAEVLAGFLRRARAALEEVEQRTGQQIQLVTDVQVSWDDVLGGKPSVGHDYGVLASAVDELILWAYLGTQGRAPGDLERLAAALDDMPVDAERFTISIGLWDEQTPEARQTEATISPEVLAASLTAAQTHHIVAVNVTPYSLMSPAHWEVVDEAWDDSGAGT